jgi:hypothetical protein
LRAGTPGRGGVRHVCGGAEGLELAQPLGMGVEQRRDRALAFDRASFEVQRAQLLRHEPPDALRAIAAIRRAMPRTILRFAGGRELTLGDLGTRQGVLGGINAIVVGNYLTTLGRDPSVYLDPARRALDAGAGALGDAVRSREALHCTGCGRPVAAGDHERCRARLAATDPPRFCATCGRKLVVQVLPIGWRARCVSCGVA